MIFRRVRLRNKLDIAIENRRLLAPKTDHSTRLQLRQFVWLACQSY